jgi:hypothetical protein
VRIDDSAAHGWVRIISTTASFAYTGAVHASDIGATGSDSLTRGQGSARNGTFQVTCGRPWD